MNFHHVMSQYKDTDITSKVEGASKHEFIKIVLEELFCENLNILSSIENEPKTSPPKIKKFC